MLLRKVNRVLSANLLELESGDRVRLISIASKPVVNEEEDSSIDYLGEFVSGRRVGIEFDRKMVDAEGNLLAYVYIDNSTGYAKAWSMINKLMIVNGYVKYQPDEINKSEAHNFQFLEALAKSDKKGVWNEQHTDI